MLTKGTRAGEEPLSALLRWRPGRYLRSSGELLGWLLLRALAQAGLVLLLSRLLGAAGYGRFVTILAIASFLSAFAGMGLAHVLLRDGARHPDRIDDMFRHALRIWGLTSLGCGLAAVGLAWQWLPGDVPWLAVSAAIIAEVVSTSLTELCARTEQARHRIGRFGALSAGLPVARLAVLVPYALLAAPSLSGWLWVYAATSLAYAGCLLMIQTRSLMPGGTREKLSIRQGIPFTMASLSMRLQMEFNKPVLAHHGFALAGNFGVAQRVVDLASLPLVALQDALWPRLYASAQPGRDPMAAAIFMLALALIGGCILWWLAPLLPHILGPDFAPAVDSLRWLALLPFLQCARNLCNYRSIAAHRTNLIGWSYAAGAAVSVACMLSLTPRLGISAAVLSAYASELAIITVQLFLARGENRNHA